MALLQQNPFPTLGSTSPRESVPRAPCIGLGVLGGEGATVELVMWCTYLTHLILHTTVRLLDYTPATSTDAHQEKLDLVKHSDDAHEAPPLGCTLDEGFEGHGRKACGAGYCRFSISDDDDDDDDVCDFYITTRKEIESLGCSSCQFLALMKW